MPGMSLFLFTRHFATWMFPLYQLAIASAVRPSESRVRRYSGGSNLSNSYTTVTCPNIAATWTAVLPWRAICAVKALGFWSRIAFASLHLLQLIPWHKSFLHLFSSPVILTTLGKIKVYVWLTEVIVESNSFFYYLKGSRIKLVTSEKSLYITELQGY